MTKSRLTDAEREELIEFIEKESAPDATPAQRAIARAAREKDAAKSPRRQQWSEYVDSYGDYSDCHGDYYDAGDGDYYDAWCEKRDAKIAEIAQKRQERIRQFKRTLATVGKTVAGNLIVGTAIVGAGAPFYIASIILQGGTAKDVFMILGIEDISVAFIMFLLWLLSVRNNTGTWKGWSIGADVFDDAVKWTSDKSTVLYRQIKNKLSAMRNRDNIKTK